MGSAAALDAARGEGTSDVAQQEVDLLQKLQRVRMLLEEVTPRILAEAGLTHEEIQLTLKVGNVQTSSAISPAESKQHYYALPHALPIASRQKLDERRMLVRLSGKFFEDSEATQWLKSELTGAIEGMEKPELILDCSGVTYWSSGAFGSLFACKRLLGGCGGKLILTNLSTEMYAPIRLGHFDELFTIRRAVRGVNAPDLAMQVSE
jgi:anti-anti-sigma factor